MNKSDTSCGKMPEQTLTKENCNTRQSIFDIELELLTEIRNNPDSKEILNKLEKRDKYLNYVCSCWLFKNQCKQRMERIKRLIREIIEKVFSLNNFNFLKNQK